MPSNKCALLHLSKTPILQQLQLEEALLRTYTGNVCILNSGAPDAVVLGVSRSPEQDVHLPSLHEDRVPLIKRYSGGGTVFIDENSLLVTWIMNSPITESAHSLLMWTHKIYAPIFPETFAITDNDYTVENKKIGGNAQYIQKNRWVHHTTFLWDMDIHKLNRYLPIPQKQPAYRKQRSHADFLTTIRPWFRNQEDFFSQLKQSARHFFHWETLSQEMVQKMIDQPHRQSTTQIT